MTLKSRIYKNSSNKPIFIIKGEEYEVKWIDHYGDRSVWALLTERHVPVLINQKEVEDIRKIWREKP